MDLWLIGHRPSKSEILEVMAALSYGPGMGYGKRQKPKKLGRGSLVRIVDAAASGYPSDRGGIQSIYDSVYVYIIFLTRGPNARQCGTNIVHRDKIVRTTADELAVLDVMET